MVRIYYSYILPEDMVQWGKFSGKIKVFIGQEKYTYDWYGEERVKTSVSWTTFP